jgi:hypothetical protein
MTVKASDAGAPAALPDQTRGEDRRRVLFRSVAVFVRRQVAPVEGVAQAPLEPPREPLTGDSHGHLLGRLRAFATGIGFSVVVEPVPASAGGWCYARAKRIVVDAGFAANAQVRVLVHELAHGLGVG